MCPSYYQNDAGTFVCARLDLKIAAGPVGSGRILTQITLSQLDVSALTRGHSRMYPSYHPNDESIVRWARIFTQLMQAQSDVSFLSPKLCGHSRLCPYFHPNLSASRIYPYSRPKDVGTFARTLVLTQLTLALLDVSS